MQHFWKRILSFSLILCMVFSVSVPAYAASDELTDIGFSDEFVDPDWDQPLDSDTQDSENMADDAAAPEDGELPSEEDTAVDSGSVIDADAAVGEPEDSAADSRDEVPAEESNMPDEGIDSPDPPEESEVGEDIPVVDEDTAAGNDTAVEDGVIDIPIVLSPDNGNTYNADDSIMLLAASNINVKDAAYGAKGDGSTDDTAALQKALDLGQSATASNPLVITVPAGTYKINKTLAIYSYTTLSLDSGATILRGDDSVRMLKSGYEDSSIGGYGQLKNVTIEGGTWDGNNNNPSNACNLMALWHGSNITVRDTTLTECCGTHFIEFTAIDQLTVSNVTFRDFVKYSGMNYDFSGDQDTETQDPNAREVSVRSEALQLDYASQESSAAALPLDGTACQNVTVTGCKFINLLGGVGNHHDDYKSTNITISGNTFQNMESVCINLSNMTGVTVSNNTATNVRAFLRATGGTNVTATKNTVTYGFTSVSDKLRQPTIYTSNSTISVSDNKIYGTGKYIVFDAGKSTVTLKNNTFDLTSFRPDGISALILNNSKVTISGNTLTNAAENGISIQGTSSSGTISNNTITKSAGNGIYVTGATSMTLSSNTITNPGSNGISVASSKATLSSNKITGAAGNGIYVSNCSDTVKLTGNTISSPTSNGVSVSASKVELSSNTITSPGSHGLYFSSSSSGKADGNTITSAKGQGISVTGSSNMTLSSNKISKGTNHGILVDGATATISSNTISDNSQIGIRLSNSAKATATSNTISGSGSHGMAAEKSQLTASSNTITGSGAHGIYLNGSTFTVTGNTVRSSTNNNIRIADTAATCSGSVTGNVVDPPLTTISNGSTGKVTVSNNYVYLSTPSVSSVANASNGVTVKWGKITGADQYRVFYNTGSGSWTKLADTTSTSYTWTGAKAGTTYAFTVRCMSADGKVYTSGYNTTGKSITTPQAGAKNGLVKDSDGVMRYYTNGKVDTTKNGVAQLADKSSGSWYYVEKGVFAKKTGIAQRADGSNTTWYFVKNGVYTKATGIAQKANGSSSTWYYVKNGQYDKTAKGVAQKADGSSSAWYYVQNGQYVKKTGIAQRADGSNTAWYFVKNGVYTKATGVAQKADGSNKVWYYVENGQYVKKTGLTQRADGSNKTWYYVQNGQYLNTYTGLAPRISDGKLFYVKNGAYLSTFNGKVTYNGKTNTVKNGAAV